MFETRLPVGTSFAGIEKELCSKYNTSIGNQKLERIFSAVRPSNERWHAAIATGIVQLVEKSVGKQLGSRLPPAWNELCKITQVRWIAVASQRRKPKFGQGEQNQIE